MNFSSPPPPPPFQTSSSLQNSGVQFSHLLHNNNSTTTTTNTQLDKLKALRESQNQFSDDLSASILNNLTSKRSSFNSGGSINYTNTSGLKQSSSRTGSGSSPGTRINNTTTPIIGRNSSGYGSSISGAPGSMPIPLAYNLRGSSTSPGPGIGHGFISGSGGSASGTGSGPGSGPHSHMDMNSPRGRHHFLEDVNELPTSTSSTVHNTTK
ncbi:unnamed protein product [[Candida] boidinii]|uniref:Unnamed protein product n=1 Tax=Candida boidinii TaxID=5477 RepID=A0ACB5U714_CANBO|nr:unnamed protein product [[Candida] boidinii]